MEACLLKCRVTKQAVYDSIQLFFFFCVFLCLFSYTSICSCRLKEVEKRTENVNTNENSTSWKPCSNFVAFLREKYAKNETLPGLFLFSPSMFTMRKKFHIHYQKGLFSVVEVRIEIDGNLQLKLSAWLSSGYSCPS